MHGLMVLGNIRDMSIKKYGIPIKKYITERMLSYSVRHDEFPLCKDCFKGECKFKYNPVK